jgi:hypothetical protein
MLAGFVLEVAMMYPPAGEFERFPSQVDTSFFRPPGIYG